nr:MAG TPA: hypothetical protein [Bacteriophage sp.]
MVVKLSFFCRFKRLFLCENKITKRRVIELYDEDLRERLLSREQIQKLDLVTQTILFSVIEDVLEEREHDKQSLSTANDLYSGL